MTDLLDRLRAATEASREKTPPIKPILFSGPMVRALLEGRKTQTRRVLLGPWRGRPRPEFRGPRGCMDDPECWGWENGETGEHVGIVPSLDGAYSDYIRTPYAPGDLLYVRESWAARLDEDHIKPVDLNRKSAFFWADGPGKCCNTGCNGAAGKVRPSIHMPRRFSRITLEVTDVRVERVQDISDEDAQAEGIYETGATGYLPPHPIMWSYGESSFDKPVWAFQHLWDSLNAKRGFGWDVNPWVAATSFEVRRQNVDDIEAAA